MANAGRVAIVPKGDYSSSTAYNRLDLVRYNEKAYVAKKVNTGILPTNTEYWMLMTSDGITIDTALSDTSTNPVQNKVVKNALDNIQTTSRATLSTAGWYRVAEFASSIASVLKGSSANSCTVALKKMHDSNGSEEYSIILRSVYTSQEFKCEDSKVNGTQQITKIRYTHDSGKAYIELYCTGSGNTTYVEINSPQNAHATWQAITPTLTSETVDGVTVTTTYDIPANASPVTDLDLANYFKNTGGEVKGDVTVTADDSTIRTFRLKNGVKDIRFVVNADGTFYVIDKTNNNKIFNNTADGTNTFNGTASGNLPLDGGTLSRPSPTPLVLQNTDSTPCYMIYRNRNSLLGYIGFSAVDNPIVLGSGGTKLGDILHTGNKPTGTYTGNGSATQRTIKTGTTVGNAVLIYSSAGFALLTPYGAITKDNSSTSVGGISWNDCAFSTSSGSIVLTTTSYFLNQDGTTYTYRVL